MNRNTWIIIIVAMIVIIGLIWIFNRGDRVASPESMSPYDKCLTSYPHAFDYCASKAEGPF